MIDQIKDEFGDNVLGDVIVGWDAARARRRLARRARPRPTSCRGGWFRSVLRRGDGDDEQQLRRQLAVPAPPARRPGSVRTSCSSRSAAS